MTKFERWFKTQFGKIPSECRSHDEIRAELAEAKMAVYRLEMEEEERALITLQWKAVLYAKQAMPDLVDAPLPTDGLNGHYWIEIDTTNDLPTGNACSGYYGENDKPNNYDSGKKWVLVKKV